ncbi:MAG: OmpA family protein [Acidobacteria bacterium]|nr:OmpA family protein [Acidobacteriota bacterium]
MHRCPDARTSRLRASILAVLTGALLGLSGCASKLNLEPPGYDAEWEKRLDSLAEAYISRDVDKVLSFYDEENYSLSFNQTYKFDTGKKSARQSLAERFKVVQLGRLSFGPDTQVWKRDSGKVWTLRSLEIDANIINGDQIKFKGKHSAIWEQKNGAWIIGYEHFWGDPQITRVAAAPVPPPAPAPPPGPPELASIAEAQGYLKDIYFDLDKWNIREDQAETAVKNLEFLKKYPSVEFTIEGHCDDRASRPYNIRLGEKRANEVKDYLIAGGIAANRITTKTFGKERPFAQGTDEDSRQSNRRAHFVVTKK